MAIFVVNLSSYSQSRYVPLDEVCKIADQNASALWGNVSSAEPIAYYAANDELIGYRFNFAIGKSFPDGALLKQQCEESSVNGDKKSRWGIDDYGTMFVSARKDIGVIQEYSKALSPEYSMGFKMEELARQSLGNAVSLKKVYYVNFVNQWFCYTNGSMDVYINVFPKTQVVGREKFLEITQTKLFFCTKGDFSEEWNAYQTGIPMASKAEVWISHPENCKFYDWSYGCTPTAAAMLLSWWDYNSINTDDNYARLVDFYFERWDDVEEEDDWQVPNVQKELAIELGTDTLTGETDRDNIEMGFNTVCNLLNYNQYNFSITDHDQGGDYEWYFNKIISEVGANDRPIQISIPEHSECCVAYDESTNLIGVHNTWWEGVQWINRNQLERVFTVVGGGALGLAITLEHPLGDTGYNHDGDGEIFISGDVFEIRWDYDDQPGSYANISYCVDGGYNWTSIVQHTPNDGVFDWHIPNIPASYWCRIYVSVYTPEDVFGGADASLGNFTIAYGGFLEQLQQDVLDTTETDPDYYEFWHGYTTWCAIGGRANDEAEWWGIEMFDDDSFEEGLAASYSLNPTEFVVMDGHHSTLTKAIKVNRMSGYDNATVEFKGALEPITPGWHYQQWVYGDVIEMFDIHLEPGKYTFLLDNSNSGPDLDIALFGSNGEAYYADRQDFLGRSVNPGHGDEVFYYQVLTEDDYGICVWANTVGNGNYVLKIEEREIWTGEYNSNWFEAYNWNKHYVPDEFTDVIIPAGTTFSPSIDNYIAHARNTEIEAGAVLICENDLHVHGNFHSDGQFIMNGNFNNLYFEGSGNSYWDDPNADDIYIDIAVVKENSSDMLSLTHSINVSGNLYISEGTFKIEEPISLTVGSSEPDAFSVGSGGHLILDGNPVIDVTGGMTFFDGSNATITGGTLMLGGNFVVENNVSNDIIFSGGTLVMNGSETQYIINQDNGNLVMHNLTIDNPGNCHIEDGDLTVNGDFFVDEGNMKLNGYEVMCAGDVTIMDGGKISVDENAILRVGQNHVLSVNNGGILEVIGEPGDRSKISVMPEGTGYYAFDINGGGTIGARRAIFERMDAYGVYLHNGAIVDPAYTFDQCIFRDGISGSAALFVILNDQDFTVTEAVFPDNTWGGQYNVWKSNNSGNVRFAGATGDFAGQDYEYDPNNLIEWFPVFWSLDIGIMLEGPFNGINMNANINNRLPEYQPYEPVLPYFGNPMPEWYHTGEEFVLSIPNTDIVDWVVVELRDAPIVQQAIPGTAIEKRAALVNKSGKIVALDGISQLIITDSFFDNVYVVVWHRNHLGIISAYPLTQTKGTLSYDFTTGPNKTYGGADAVKELAPGIWGMISGDSDGNGMIDDSDKTSAWSLQAGTALYSGCDLNMDFQIDNLDKNDIWMSNLNYHSFIPSAFGCGEALVDSRDGQTYTTVQIGTQCWMAENLNIGTMISGSVNMTNNSVMEKYCFNNIATNCNTYGGLYQWDEMMQYMTTPGLTGICPAGWHLPADAEWCTMEQVVDLTISCTTTGWRGADGGGKLKEIGYQHWLSPNTGATNSTNFTTLPGGSRYYVNGTFNDLQTYGTFWSSTESSTTNAWYRRLSYIFATVGRSYSQKTYGYSVRCVKD